MTGSCIKQFFRKPKTVLIFCVSLAIIGAVYYIYFKAIRFNWRNPNLAREEDISDNLKTSFMVFVNSYAENETQNCGGTLIMEDFVLTAAHCVYHTSDVLLLLGTTSLHTPKPQYLFESSDIIIHEDYDSLTHQNDIALIKLPQKIDLTGNIKTIDLFHIDTSKCQDKQLPVLGWGMNDTNQGLNSELLIKNVTTVEESQCDLLIKDQSTIFSVGANGPYVGDSGGPLICENTQIGIVSGSNCGVVLYSNISFYCDWITMKVEAKIC